MNRKILTSLLLFCLSFFLSNCVLAQNDDSPWVFPSTKDYPQIITEGKQIANFIPSGWHILGQASGSLHSQNSKDVVLVLKGNNHKFKQKNTDLGVAVFDTNPRMLIILFNDSKSGTYKLAERNNTIIPIPDSPTMDEPFKAVSIHNKILKLDFAVWLSAGSWISSESSYKFRWQDNKFVLIGADSHQSQRNTGEETDYSYNFLTGKERITTSNCADNNAGEKTRWKTLKVNKLRTLDSFKHLYEWQVTGDEYL